MHYKKLLKGQAGFSPSDTQRAIQFLVEKFGAVKYKHPYLDNLAVLDKRLWWIVTTIDNASVDICQGSESLKYDILNQIDKLDAGILIFRQFHDHRLCVYLVDDIDILQQNLKMGLVLSWEIIDTHKIFSEVGMLMGDEVIGFKRLRQLHPSMKNPYPCSIT